MIIHFSANHKDTLITVCLNNYDIIFSVSFAGKEHTGETSYMLFMPDKGCTVVWPF